MGIYIPSCVAHITLKFDESLQIQREEQSVSVDDLIKAGSKRSSTGTATKPLIVARDQYSYVMNIVPQTATISLPEYRKAGSFDLSFAFSQLPVDPRTVRAASVELHVGTVSAENFARGVSQPMRVGQPRLSVLDTRNADLGQAGDTLVMTGLLDKWRVEHNESASMIQLSGRDVRGVLIDTPLSTDPKEDSQIASRLKLDQPIDELIAQLLSFHPLFARSRFVVAICPSEWGAAGVPSVGDPKIIPRHKRGAKGKKSQVQSTSELNRMSFWDLIVQFCYFVGAIPIINGTEIMIRPARSLYKQQNAGVDPTNPAPFAGGAPRRVDAESGSSIGPLRVRRLVYGRDIASFDLERSFSGYQRPRVVRVISHDSSSTERGEGKTLVAWWPPVPDKVTKRTKATTGQEKPQEEIVDVPVYGIRDKNRLEAIAHSIYEEAGRGEIVGNADTQKLSSFGGSNADPDLLRLRVGDAVELGVDTRPLRSVAPLVSEYTDNQRKPFSQLVEDLKNLLGDANLANVLAATSRGNVHQLQRFFRVSSVKYSWDNERGIRVSFGFQNYLEVRYDADKTPAVPKPAVKRIEV